MTATTLLFGWLLLGQTSTLPVPVTPSSRRFADAPQAELEGTRSVLTIRETAGEFGAPPSLGVEPISAQPLRPQPTAAPLQSPNPPTQPVLGAAFSQPSATMSQPLGQAPAAGEGLAKRLVTQAFPSSDWDNPNIAPPTASEGASPAAQASNLSLRDALATTPDRARQQAIIRTFWEASSLMADGQFAREELQLVDSLPAPRTSADQAELAAAQTAAQARFVEAEMASLTARFALGDAVGQLGDEPPLPADVPFVGKYRTEYDAVFVGRAAPLGVKRIHATLPLRRELVDARAAAVVAGVNALDEQIGSYRSGQLPLSQVLSSMNALRLQRGAFLGAVRDYNLDIAEYALAAAQPSDPPEKIVAMLIEVEPGEATRSVLIAPTMSRVVEPVGGSFGTPAQLSPAAQLARPSTERVLGSFRDVTSPTQPAEVEARPRSSFGAVGETSDLPPALPPR